MTEYELIGRPSLYRSQGYGSDDRVSPKLRQQLWNIRLLFSYFNYRGKGKVFTNVLTNGTCGRGRRWPGDNHWWGDNTVAEGVPSRCKASSVVSYPGGEVDDVSRLVLLEDCFRRVHVPKVAVFAGQEHVLLLLHGLFPRRHGRCNGSGHTPEKFTCIELTTEEQQAPSSIRHAVGLAWWAHGVKWNTCHQARPLKRKRRSLSCRWNSSLRPLL